ALQILERHQNVDLLFTDVGLPGGMNGRQLANLAQQRHPGMKVLFTTGYARNAIIHDGRLDAGVQLITKPFTYTRLREKIAEMLELHRHPCTVLVVEDIEPVRMTLVEMLGSLGAQVLEAGTAMEAMNHMRAAGSRLDGALIDIGLPDRRGDVLAMELRAMSSRFPVVIASGYGRNHVHPALREDDRVRFLTKPYDADQLQAAFAELGLRLDPPG